MVVMMTGFDDARRRAGTPKKKIIVAAVDKSG